jgi:alpha-amylase
MRKTTLLFSTLFSLMLFSCTNEPQVDASTTAANTDSAAKIDGHPAWVEQGNIYEVNVRQYTPEGTFKAFEKHLQRLKDMGVQTLWFMPVQPIGVEGRKGALGSYYAVSDYRAVNPEFGTMNDWKALVDTIHGMGMKVIIDWVPNHTAPDHPWVKTHPEFYFRDSVTGKPIHQPGTDWTDTRKLDFKNNQMADSMIAAMKYWITETGIDGFRCDHAQGPGKEFWKRCNAELKKIKNVLMLAEAEDEWVYDAGFDMSYAWKIFHLTKDIAAGKRPANAIDTLLQQQDSIFPSSATFLYFTSNHDENSWNKAEYATMPGASHAPFAVLTQTIDQSVPLIYSGQEEPFLDSISFFYKDTISFNRYQRAGFYKTLLNLRKNNSALAANASFKKRATSNDAAMYAFEREKEGNKILVVLNLSKNAQNFTWKDKPSAVEWNNVFAGNKEPVDKGFGIEPWGYAVYEIRK